MFNKQPRQGEGFLCFLCFFFKMVILLVQFAVEVFVSVFMPLSSSLSLSFPSSIYFVFLQTATAIKPQKVLSISKRKEKLPSTYVCVSRF